MTTAVYWIDIFGAGKIGIMPCPCGDVLDKEIAALHTSGVDILVSLLPDGEMLELQVADEAKLCAKHRLEFLSLPIADFQVPTSMVMVHHLICYLQTAYQTGRTIVIHCRGGIGRSSMIAASLLVSLGVTLQEAWQHIGRARNCKVPETAAQEQWVQHYVQTHLLSV